MDFVSNLHIKTNVQLILAYDTTLYKAKFSSSPNLTIRDGIIPMDEMELT